MNTEKLEAMLLKVVKKPLTYPQIEKRTKSTDAYLLGLALSRLISAGKIYYTEPTDRKKDTFLNCWPVYSSTPVSKKFKCPERDEAIITSLPRRYVQPGDFTLLWESIEHSKLV